MTSPSVGSARSEKRDGHLNTLGVLATRLAVPFGTFVTLGLVLRYMAEDAGPEFVTAYAVLPLFSVLADFGMRHKLAPILAQSLREGRGVFDGARAQQRVGRFLTMLLSLGYLNVTYASLAGWSALGLAAFAAFVSNADVRGHALRAIGAATVEARLAVAQIVTTVSGLAALAAFGVLTAVTAAVVVSVPAVVRSFVCGRIVEERFANLSGHGSGSALLGHDYVGGLETATGIALARTPLLIAPIVGITGAPLAQLTIAVLLLQQFEMIANVGANSYLPRIARGLAHRADLVRSSAMWAVFRRATMAGLVASFGACLLYPVVLRVLDGTLEPERTVRWAFAFGFLITMSHFVRFVLLGSDRSVPPFLAGLLSLGVLWGVALSPLVPMASPFVRLVLLFVAVHLVLLALNTTFLLRPREHGPGE